jgi:hypothetical protein
LASVPLDLAQRQGQQHAGHQLSGKALVDATPISGSGLGQQGQVGFTHQRADADVADRQAGKEAQLLGITQCGQGIGSLTGLGNGHEQRVGLHHHLAIAEFAGDFDLARNPGQAFEPVTGDHAGVIAGATRYDLHVAYFGEQLGGLRPESLYQNLLRAQAIFQGALYDRVARGFP